MPTCSGSLSSSPIEVSQRYPPCPELITSQATWYPSRPGCRPTGRSWDSGQISYGLELLRDAPRHSTGISPDARHVQPLLALAAALVDLRQLGLAKGILCAGDNRALRTRPADAALSLLRSRIHLAAGRLADAAADAQAALAVARALGAHGYAATAHSVGSMIGTGGGTGAVPWCRRAI